MFIVLYTNHCIIMTHALYDLWIRRTDADHVNIILTRVICDATCTTFDLKQRFSIFFCSRNPKDATKKPQIPKNHRKPLYFKPELTKNFLFFFIMRLCFYSNYNHNNIINIFLISFFQIMGFYNNNNYCVTYNLYVNAVTIIQLIYR